jgi:hypothetical protein
MLEDLKFGIVTFVRGVAMFFAMFLMVGIAAYPAIKILEWVYGCKL